ncbi:hypothetical protein PYCC9005_003528 [Savitreella phatthalungensis]
MGRKKITIKPISDDKTRKVTFNRRRNGILKKAHELAVLCDTQVVVLMFDRKNMCHVYSSDESSKDSAQVMMERYISKDFCTVDPIRNYDTSPDLQLDDPAQGVWRITKDKVAVVNTYAVIPNTGDTPKLSQGQQQSIEDDDDDDELDGSEQLQVRSQRTYHTTRADPVTAAGLPRAGSHLQTPAMTEKAGSMSPDLQQAQVLQRQQQQLQRQHQQAAVIAATNSRYLLPEGQSASLALQQGLGITNSGYTPIIGSVEQGFGPALYPQQVPLGWSSGLVSPEQFYQAPMLVQPVPRAPPLSSSNAAPFVNYPLRTPVPSSPKKGEFDRDYVYPSMQQQQQLQQQHCPEEQQVEQLEIAAPTRTPRQVAETRRPSVKTPALPQETPSSTGLQFEFRNQTGQQFNPYTETTKQRSERKSKAAPGDSRTTTPSLPESPSKKPTTLMKVATSSHVLDPPSRRVTRSQSKSPRLGHARLPSIQEALAAGQAPQPHGYLPIFLKSAAMLTTGDEDDDGNPLPAMLQPASDIAGLDSIPAVESSGKHAVPLHMRGPSLLDDISFDPVTGCAMMEPQALSNWLTGNPLLGAGASPGHSRQTSHIRGESCSMWLNIPREVIEEEEA